VTIDGTELGASVAGGEGPRRRVGVRVHMECPAR
jgi:hypothetical protein